MSGVSLGGRLARKYKISGRVQGVGFRYFAQRVAKDLGVRGWTRNLEDGSVEVVAWGTRRQIENLEGELRIGPPSAEVRGVEVEDVGLDVVQWKDFRIR